MINYPHTIICGRARTLLEQVLKPGIYSNALALDTAIYQSTEPIRYQQAIEAEYRPVSLGHLWGPIWSTAWFRLRGRVPEDFGPSFRLLFDTRTEALCWWDGAPYQGVELHRQDVRLPESVRPGDALEVYIEAACNHMLGVGDKFGDPPRFGEFPSRQEGKLTLAHVARYHPDRAAMYYDLLVLTDVLEAMPESSPRARQLGAMLHKACDALDVYDLDGCNERVRHICREALSSGASPGSNTVHCVGNTHIDLAWLWPIRETKRKASRSFSTVLRYMERHPEYRFVQSQPQLYEWVRQDYPELFEQIKQRIKEGRWEAAGGMWVEADCNIPSGESLVRQLQHGIRYFREHFGTPQRFLWLPDVFGYSAALPQILRGVGIEAFVTQKISWNQFNRFPHNSFNWIGIDGTEIPSHFLPADTYIAQNTPVEFDRGERQYAQSGQLPAWLQAYGWGDGGGGPTEESIERVNRMGACEGMPRVRHSSVGDFVDKLVESAPRLPSWSGELYLELHRGTYTSQAQLKRYNRLGEFRLKEVELLEALLGSTPADQQIVDQAWKDLLLNQFHDVIPGSSIEWVNREARALYQQVIDTCQAQLDTLIGNAGRNTSADTSLVVLNTRSQGQGGLVECPVEEGSAEKRPGLNQTGADATGQRVTLLDLPDMRAPGVYSLAVPDRSNPAAGSLHVEERVLENAHLRVELDEAGRVTRLLNKRVGHELVRQDQPANQLMLYDDRPLNWDAWDLEVYYRESGRPINSAAESLVVEKGPLRAAIEFKRAIGRSSTLTQRVQLGYNDRHVVFDTLVDWREERTLLRALHPVAIHSDHAHFEVQYGYVRRSNHFNTSWDYARFESVAHRWMDLSEPGRGVSLLNDCKYGHSCLGQVMGVSLLRSPREPDPTADQGQHRFRYALYPHDTFDASEITLLAEAFNQPLRVWGGCLEQTKTGPLFYLEGPHGAKVVVESIKPAEDGDGTIVRLRETSGGRGVATCRFMRSVKVTETDLLERPIDGVRAGDVKLVDLDFTPFRLRTLRIH